MSAEHLHGRRQTRSTELPDPGRLARLRVAYDEGVRALDDQASELDSVRQRAVQYLAFVGSATAFLVGIGVGSPGNDAQASGFYILASVATFVSITAIVLVLMVLIGIVPRDGRLSRAKWNFRVSPSLLIGRWIDPEIGARAEEEFFHDLAVHYGQTVKMNATVLNKIRTCYWAFLLVASTQVLLWAAVVWVYA